MHAPMHDKIVENIERSDTDDLLDRVTAFRRGMEPAAIALIEAELRKRGVKESEVEKHNEECVRTCLYWPDGPAMECSLCRRPAVVVTWGWHRMLGKIPVFPRQLRLCQLHRPEVEEMSDSVKTDET